MQADGYTTVDVTPWETASGGKAVVCNRPAPCTLTTKPGRPEGTYAIGVRYFDLRTGASQYHLLLNGKSVAHWTANATLPPRLLIRTLTAAPARSSRFPGFTSSHAIRLPFAERRTKANPRQSIT